MKSSTSTNVFGIVVLSLLMMFAFSTQASAQGRGRGNRNWGDKCSKFVNCHDARDGRWDGRGPNRSTGFTNVFRRHHRHERNRDWWERRDRRHNWDRNRNWRRRG
jgi:hypothetical protein